jgi:hypothetical protein
MKQSLVLSALVASIGSAHAATLLTQWNFNSVPPDGNTNTGTLTPNVGTGTALTVGGVSSAFASGAGSSDPATQDDSGWNVSNFKPQGTGNKEAGVEFQTSTIGFTGIKFAFDQRHSGTAARRATVQYSVDSGSTWVDAAVFDATAHDTFFNGRTADLSAVTALDNKADVRFRIVATFSTETGYLGSNVSSNTAYSPQGTWRFDMVSVTAEQPVPEPGTMAALGLGAAAMLRRRRK